MFFAETELVLYPLKTWKDQQTRLAELPRSDERARAFRRYIYANAIDCELDKQGRINIASSLVSYADLKKDYQTKEIFPG